MRTAAAGPQMILLVVSACVNGGGGGRGRGGRCVSACRIGCLFQLSELWFPYNCGVLIGVSGRILLWAKLLIRPQNIGLFGGSFVIFPLHCVGQIMCVPATYRVYIHTHMWITCAKVVYM